MNASKLLIVVVTILATLVTVELWGQADTPDVVQTTQFRYQVSAFGTQVRDGAYVVDTLTGEQVLFLERRAAETSWLGSPERAISRP